MAEDAWGELIDQQAPVVEEVEEAPSEPITPTLFGLIHVGHLTDTFEVFGSKVSIRTLKIGEELEAELLISKYRNTQEENRAYMTALVAACITSVDNQPLIQSLGPSGETLERKFAYISENWNWITIAAIYDHYRLLVNKVMESLDEVKKKVKANDDNLLFLVKMLDRQKKFEGDLNSVQTEIVRWLMILDDEKERLDWEMMALAANPGTNKPLLDWLTKMKPVDPELPFQENGEEWYTPETPEEAAELVALLEAGMMNNSPDN